ncbi:MAG: iron transporter [Bdellovibrionales bacterium RIFOXYC1_FULL_54_43]|nr:MAG: iron transporter [Bdellovibrionales bacterium RIFOXYC1_FULL_54_43]
MLVSLEFTPNPNTLKYLINRSLLSQGTANFRNRSEAEHKSPLAVKLFSIPGIEGVMVGRNFVTVTKTEDGDWDEVHQKCSTTIETHLNDGLPVLTDAALKEHSETSNVGSGSDPVVTRIREILDQEIRPAVAMDGGDIVFESYKDGIVYLHLQGACAGCPGATMTLKMGVENRLREAIPEVKEVVSV